MTGLMERADWTDFRHLDGLVARGGISADHLRRLTAKELHDNAADEVDKVGLDICPTLEIAEDGAIVVEDAGPGIDGAPEAVARLFSFNRDRLSSKYARKPTRGLLGNGLRLVSGAVFASQGRLDVWTRDQHLRLQPQLDGSTTVLSCESVDYPTGTRIAVWLDPATIRADETITAWLTPAHWMFGGARYTGRSSPHWFDGPAFFEYLQSARGMTVRKAVADLARCTGAMAGELTRRWSGQAADLSPAEAAELLTHLQAFVEPVPPKLLKAVGRREEEIDLPCYARTEATFCPPSATSPQATIPVLIEVWGMVHDGDRESYVWLGVNRSPSTARLSLSTRFASPWATVVGCGLGDDGDDDLWIETKRNAPVILVVNITAPHLARTSDGKAPDLGALSDPIAQTFTRVLNTIEKRWPSPKPSATGRGPRRGSVITKPKTFKAAVTERWQRIAEGISNGFQRHYTERQLFYPIRDEIALSGECKGELRWSTFTGIIDEIEAERGRDLPMMVRDNRGLIYHPHTHTLIPLGTLSVAEYERPEWLYANLLYIEKEGFIHILADDGWPERWDCAVMTAKGQATRASKDLIDFLAASDEPIRVFAAHDADAPGTIIYQALQGATSARPKRQIEIVNLGLDPWEARDTLHLPPVPFDKKSERHRPVAQYVLDRPDGAEWEAFLQDWRFELDAIPPGDDIPWFDGKMVEHGARKAVPGDETLATKAEEHIAEALRVALRGDLMRRYRLDHKLARIENQLDRAMQRAAPMIANAIADHSASLEDDVRRALEDELQHRWVEELKPIADEIRQRLRWVPPA